MNSGTNIISDNNIDFLNLIFGERNGTTINPRKNVNYIEDSINLTPKVCSDNIANAISTFLNEKDIIAIVIPGNFGGSVMSFLDNDNYKFVITYESDPMMTEILNNNLKQYGFDPSRYDIIDAKFKTIPEDLFKVKVGDQKFLPVIIHLDPPLETDGRLTINGEFIEDVIKKYNKTKLITVRVPKDYKFKLIDGWHLESFDCGDNSIIYFAVPKTYFNSSQKDQKDQKGQGKGQEKSKGKKDSPLKRKPSTQKQSEGLIKKQDIKEAQDKDPEQPKQFTTVHRKLKCNNELWEKELREYLRNILLPKTRLNEENILKMTDDEAMRRWTRTFTHFTWNPNDVDNYDPLETFGDFVMSTTFVDYHTNKVPGLNQEDITELKKQFMSTDAQSKMALSLGLHHWVRSRIPNNRPILEDVLEAVFGTLVKLGNKKFNSKGYGIAYNLMSDLMKDFNIDYENIEKDPITNLLEIFKALGWPVPKFEQIENDDGTTTIVIDLPPEAQKDIYAWNQIQPRNQLGVGTGTTPKEARPIAASMALKELESWNINRAFTKRRQLEKLLEMPEFRQYKNDLLDILAKQGYIDILFKEIKKKKARYVILMGTKDNSRKEWLHTYEASMKETTPQAKIQSMKEYLNRLQTAQPGKINPCMR